MTISITYDQNKTTTADKGTQLLSVLNQLPQRDNAALAAIVNGELQELDYPLYIDSTIQWVDITSSIGWHIYRRSLIYLLSLALKENYPTYKLWVSHSLPEGCFCWAENAEGKRLDQKQIQVLASSMDSYVKENISIERTSVSREDAAAFFANEGKTDKADLLLKRDYPYLSLYRAHGFSEYLFGRMAILTGLLQDFALIPFENGFVLCLPPRQYLGLEKTKKELSSPRQLQASLLDYYEWSQLLEIRTVSDLNTIVEQGNQSFGELMLIAETLQERTLHKISDDIIHQKPHVKVIFLAGPSSSGKTTTARRLCIQFRTLGVKPHFISMDDYFIDKHLTPVNERGNKDFEELHALNIELLCENLTDLINGNEASLPQYDFLVGQSIPNQKQLALDESQVLIVEGIHALNETVSQCVPKHLKCKIFVSALSQLNLDANTPISTSDNRLIRRIVRDAHSRGISPVETLNLWNEVRRGEHRNIFPYQEEADYFINSALIYELPVLRPLIEKQLAAITDDQSCFLEASRILRLIRYFSPAPDDLVPRNSVLQEFIGNSLFD